MFISTSHYIYWEDASSPPLPPDSSEALKRRLTYIKFFGFVIIHPDTLKAIPTDKPIVSVGAGSGALERALTTHKKADIVATDSYTGEYSFSVGKHFPTEKLGASKAVDTYASRRVLMSWPSYDATWPYNALRKMHPAQELVFIGEGKGGCTGDNRFHNYLAKRFDNLAHSIIPQWYGLHDYATVWRKQ